jgi:hypothetical protein
LQVSTGAGGTQQSLSSNSGAAVGVFNTYNHDFQIASNATLSAAGAWTAKYTAATGFELRGDGTQVFWGNTGLTSGSGFSPAERARFGSDGSFLVNTTTDGGWGGNFKMEVRAAVNGFSAYNNGSSGSAAFFRVDNPAAIFQGFSYGTSSIGTIYTDNTNFQFSSVFATRFQAGGAGGVELASGATAWSAISDYRLKDIAGPFEGAGVMVDAIPVYSARYKDRQQYRPMFLAHEAQAGGAGFAVTGEKDAVDGDGHPIYQTMQTTDPLVAALWAALRETRQALSQLQARVTVLEAAA